VTDVRLPVDGATVSVSDGVLGMLEMLALDALAPHQHQYVETARHKGLALELTGPAADAVVGDPRRLRQVLMNLVGNAVTFTEHGRIDVDVSVSGTEVRVAVRDTGAGMSADEVSHLFQPFSQGAQGARHGGTGPGLALDRQLVELMGGRIDLTSEPGSGSSFTVVVDLPPPLRASRPPRQSRSSRRPPHRPDAPPGARRR
jgi:signal transduction histidine kinase